MTSNKNGTQEKKLFSGSVFHALSSNYQTIIIIGDVFLFGASGIQTWKMRGTFQKNASCGAVTRVNFMLLDAVLCLQSQFEDYTFCIAEYSNTYIAICVPFDEKLLGSFFLIWKGEAFRGLL